MTEEDLIKGIQAGNEEAFRELFEKYRNRVFNTCNSIVHNPSDADDLVQEVFIEIYRSSGKFRGESRISTWIYRIAINKGLNHMRQVNRRKWYQSIENLASLNLRQTPAASAIRQPDTELEDKQQAQRLHSAIDDLPENQRTAFLLSKYEDLSYLEIAEVMNTSLSAVESLIHRAKSNLQKKLYSFYKKMLDEHKF